MAIAVFSYETWAILYPELADTVDEARATALFGQAGLYLNNTDCSPVTDVGQRLSLLNMLVAHLASIGGAGGRPAGAVGRLGRAQEGSVSVSYDMAPVNGLEAWYSQTPYGFQYWAATAGYRTAQYIPGPVPFVDPFPFAGGYRGFGWRA